MKKEDFNTVKWLAIVANLATSIMLCFIGAFVFWIIKRNDATLYFMIGFAILYVMSCFMVYKAGQKLSDINFKGTAKDLKENALKESKIAFLPFLFTITINRIRKSMWDYYTTSKMENVDSPLERMKISLEILEELHNDGYVPQMEYEKKKGNLLENIEDAKKFEAEQAIRKEKGHVEDEKEDDSWI